MLPVILCGVILLVNTAVLLADIILARQFRKNDEAKDIDRFYIICPCCGTKINLSQTHVYMEDETNDRN